MWGAPKLDGREREWESTHQHQKLNTQPTVYWGWQHFGGHLGMQREWSPALRSNQSGWGARHVNNSLGSYEEEQCQVL